MTGPEIVAVLEAQFGDKLKAKAGDAMDPCVTVEPNDLVAVCTFLRDDPRTRFEMLNDISGVDYLEPDPKKAPKFGFEPHMEVVYHMSSFTHQHRFTVKVSLPRWKGDKAGSLPELPTLVNVWRAADWHERECFDLCGVDFIGHPNLTRILLSEDWEGHPLRKDYEFPLEYHGIRGR